MANGYEKKFFIEAKYDFEMMKLEADTDPTAKCLGVGCGMGVTSRHLEKKLGPKATVTGITLSPNEVK
jgi:cyclopropane fatty-acyl-phospholipid synthase-like methyltransferase